MAVEAWFSIALGTGMGCFVFFEWIGEVWAIAWSMVREI